LFATGRTTMLQMSPITRMPARMYMVMV
jgi:hypothetical protein